MSRRFDPTSGMWITFADQRQDRTHLPPADRCPLCPSQPGRALTEIPREAFEIAVFDNRFPAFSPDADSKPTDDGLYATRPASGRCEVVVYTDQHGATLGQLGRDRVRLLVDVWAHRTSILSTEPGVAHVMPFENRGEAVGVTLHHPHGQVYAYNDTPPRTTQLLAAGRAHHDRTGRCVWCEVAAREASDGQRVVAESESVIAFVPYASRFPYEVQVVPRVHVVRLPELSTLIRDDLASVLHRVLVGYDALFGFPLPYVLAVQQAPVSDRWDDVAHLRIEIAPPNRSAEKLKFLAGSELAAGSFIGDVLPETAAARLRGVIPQ